MALAEVDAMSTAEFIQWQIYEKIEPFGEAGEEFRHGRLMALLANVHRDEKRKPEPFTAADFMHEPEPYLTPEERLLRQQMMELAALGG